MAPKKNPWAKFYFSDWRSDACVRLCSLAARGLWMEMLGIMHDAEPYGHLLVNGKTLTNRQLANQVGGGITEQDIINLLSELEEAGVFSRTTEGVIYSRRMVRDRQKEAEDRANGSRGGNPKIIDQADGGVNPKPEGGLTPGEGEGDKAQKPEARIQIPPIAPQRGVRSRTRKVFRFGGACTPTKSARMPPGRLG